MARVTHRWRIQHAVSRVEVAPALLVAHALGADVVTVHLEEERVGEAEVVVRGAVTVGPVVVLHAECEVKAVEAAVGEKVEVVAPELAGDEPVVVLVNA